MKNNKVECFTLYNDRGQSVFDADLLKWRDDLNHPSGIFGPVVSYSWKVNGQLFQSSISGSLQLLPDSSGFICFEKKWKPDNAVLFDAYGKEGMRLIVPMKLIPGMDELSIKDSKFASWFELSGKQGQCVLIVRGGGMDDDFGCDFDYVNGIFLKCYRVRI
jgi:hypothetical protein